MCVENVNGQTCSSCIPDYWGFGSAGGCMPCECNITGELHMYMGAPLILCYCALAILPEIDSY